MRDGVGTNAFRFFLRLLVVINAFLHEIGVLGATLRGVVTRGTAAAASKTRG
jgi:hypothetical protein